MFIRISVSPLKLTSFTYDTHSIYAFEYGECIHWKFRGSQYQKKSTIAYFVRQFTKVMHICLITNFAAFDFAIKSIMLCKFLCKIVCIYLLCIIFSMILLPLHSKSLTCTVLVQHWVAWPYNYYLQKLSTSHIIIHYSSSNNYMQLQGLSWQQICSFWWCRDWWHQGRFFLLFTWD